MPQLLPSIPHRAASRRFARRGAAVIEFALVLPFMVVLVLGSIEVGRAVMIQQSLEDASRAACRVYSAKDTTHEQMEAMVDEAMAQAGITTYDIQLDPAAKADVDEPLEPVAVTVTVKYSDISWIPPWFMGETTLAGKTVLPADLE